MPGCWSKLQRAPHAVSDAASTLTAAVLQLSCMKVISPRPLQPRQGPAYFLPRETTHLKGASPVPGPTMMMGLAASSGSRKSRFLYIYTGILSPT